MTDPGPLGLIVMCLVLALCAATLVALPMIAGNTGFFRRSHREHMPGGVHGGRHVEVGGRSVGPSWGRPVTELPQAGDGVTTWEDLAARAMVPRARLPEQPVPGQPVPEQPASGEPASGQPVAREPASGQGVPGPRPARGVSRPRTPKP